MHLRRLAAITLIPLLALALVSGCGNSAVTPGADPAAPSNGSTDDGPAEDALAEPNPPAAPTDSDEPAALPELPQSYSALRIEGDADRLPAGAAGEVSIVAINAPEDGSAFPFVLHNRTGEPISRIEVTGQALTAAGDELGTGASQAITPNVVLPDGYAIGYIYVETPDFKLPAGAQITEPRLRFSTGLNRFENLITVDVSTFAHHLGDRFTGEVTNPHPVVVAGPLNVEVTCVDDAGHLHHHSGFVDTESLEAGDSVAWTIPLFAATPPECVVSLAGASGYDF